MVFSFFLSCLCPLARLWTSCDVQLSLSGGIGRRCVIGHALRNTLRIKIKSSEAFDLTIARHNVRNSPLAVISDLRRASAAISKKKHVVPC